MDSVAQCVRCHRPLNEKRPPHFSWDYEAEGYGRAEGHRKPQAYRMCSGCEEDSLATYYGMVRECGPNVAHTYIVEPAASFDARWSDFTWEAFGVRIPAEQVPAKSERHFPCYVDREETTGEITFGIQLWEQRVTWHQRPLCVQRLWRPWEYEALNILHVGGITGEGAITPDPECLRMAQEILNWPLLVRQGKRGRPDGSSQYGINTLSDLRVKAIPIITDIYRKGKHPSQERVAQHIGCSEDALRGWVRDAGFSSWREFLKTVPRPPVWRTR